MAVIGRGVLMEDLAGTETLEEEVPEEELEDSVEEDAEKT